MQEIYLYMILGLFMGIILGAIAIWYLYKDDLRYLRAKNDKSTQTIVLLQEKLKNSVEKIEFLQDTKEELKVEFETLSNKIFDYHNRQNSNELKNIVEFFSKDIKEFEKKVEEFYSNEAKERFSFAKEIEKLTSLNNQLSSDTINLTNALKGKNQKQGAWGEMILGRVLENSGLRKDREYKTQKSYRNSKNELLRPDVVIYLPQKEIIIDSKVSLVSFERYIRGEESAKEQLIKSIKTHIDNLSKKNYQELNKNFDFIYMFIPIEGVFLIAVEEDLITYAQKKEIILVSPSTLIATLKMIELIWHKEYQNKNVQIIAKKAGQMYDKFVLFVNDIENIGINLQKATDSYNKALKKLNSKNESLIAKANALKEIGGVDSKKEKIDF